MSNDVIIEHKIFGEVLTPRGDFYRVAYGRFNSKTGVMLRLFSKHQENGLIVPSRFGVLMFPSLFPKIMDVFEDAEDYLYDQGIVE